MEQDTFDKYLNKMLKEELSETDYPLDFLVNDIGLDYDALAEYFNNRILENYEAEYMTLTTYIFQDETFATEAGWLDAQISWFYNSTTLEELIEQTNKEVHEDACSMADNLIGEHRGIYIADGDINLALSRQELIDLYEDRIFWLLHTNHTCDESIKVPDWIDQIGLD